MKKVLAVLFAAAFALSMSTGVFAAENIALKGTGIGSNPDLSNPDDTHEGSLAVDGDPATYYGSTKNDETMANGEYVGVMLDKTYELDSLVIYWGGGRPDEDGYKLEVTTDGTNWETVTGTVSRANPDNTHYTDTITLSDGVKASGVRALVTKKTGKNTLQCWEFEVYGTEVVDTTDDDKTESDAPAADDKEDDKTDAPAADDKEDDKTETSKPDTSKPADKPATNPDTGVESVAVWAVLFAAAAAVILTVKKVRA